VLNCSRPNSDQYRRSNSAENLKQAASPTIAKNKTFTKKVSGGFRNNNIGIVSRSSFPEVRHVHSRSWKPVVLVLGCMIVYALLQFVTVAVLGASTTDRPLAETASLLLGRGGEVFVVISVMISTYAWLSGAILNMPRLACSLALGGFFPRFLGRLHARFNTPATAIVLFSATVWLLAATGTFLWALALSAGSTVVIYTGMCAALIRLRQQQPDADALRVPFGRTLAVGGILISMALLTRLHSREALLMGITALIATANWWWAKRRELQKQPAVIAATASE